MIIGVLGAGEADKRVALTPKNVAQLIKLNVSTVLVESGAGNRAFFQDQEYSDQGGEIVDRDRVLTESTVIVTVAPPTDDDVRKIKPGTVMLGVYYPLTDKDLVSKFADGGITSFSLDLIPRTTRAQAMDVLSSMATVSGYKAVLLAQIHLPKFFPMFMTAAGTITPAKVLVLGAGVAGLQAIATAKRMGAQVSAFDVRAAAKEEVLSLGAKFIEVEGATDDKEAGGYAVEQTEEFKKRQAELIKEHSQNADVIITSAQILGKKAPLLVSEETVNGMKPGAVVVDLAAVSGGNCAFSEPDQIVNHNGVTIIGYTNLPSTMPADASLLYGNNLLNFLKLIIKEGELDLNMEDDLVVGTMITHDKQVVHERIKGLVSTPV